MEILDAAYKNTSTDIRLILSTKSGLVEVVEIVEVLIITLLAEDALQIRLIYHSSTEESTKGYIITPLVCLCLQSRLITYIYPLQLI